MTHNGLYLVFLLSFNLKWRRLLSQPIILKIFEKADMKNWMYCLQDRAVGEIQLVNRWSHSLQHLEGSHIPVLELQPKVLSAQKNLLAHGILYIPAVSICLALLSFLGVQQALLHQLLDLLHLLDLLNASNTTIDPVQHIHRHPNWSPIDYLCCRQSCSILNTIIYC